ncbi:hypothetical protein [Phytoactinopolyspora halotolerans]|uniref:DUF4064 domain-containing protein n=1 Tax=Phytoactinopolyspora halotolerans TaxID=1981512 RepID=A0A6L9SHN7_9ACTN|nr:hypothetical protein [Phytoactinopolyspora halotolerans]NEE04756.1 hypothetical protein [Phytoactinopolyspora halotolerans]
MSDTTRTEAPPRRTGEIVLAVVGMVVSGLFLGGFAVVINGVDERVFLAEVYPAMTSAGIAVAEPGDPAHAAQGNDAYQAARTLAGWFGFTLLAVLATNAVGIFLARRRPWRGIAGWWFLAAGLFCLIGSQLVLYPVAFLFFLAAGLFAVRKIPPPEPMGAPE